MWFAEIGVSTLAKTCTVTSHVFVISSRRAAVDNSVAKPAGVAPGFLILKHRSCDAKSIPAIQGACSSFGDESMLFDGACWLLAVVSLHGACV